MVKSDQILVKMTLFADGLDVRYERKHRVKDDPEVWGQSTWEVFLLKWRKKQVLKVRSGVWVGTCQLWDAFYLFTWSCWEARRLDSLSMPWLE